LIPKQSPKHFETRSTAGTPIPWMTDEAPMDDRDEDEPPSLGAQMSVTSMLSRTPSPGPPSRPGTTSPTPRLPGYIPGMTRPLTPRDVDSDDGATGYSTTPRARSPAQPHHSHHASNHTHSLPFSYSRHQPQFSVSSEGQSILPPSILRSSRGSAQMSPLRTTSPGLGNRSRGNSSSNTSAAPSPVPSPAPEERLKSDLLARRPLSPLIGGIVSNGYNGSRPATPSAAGSWQPSSPLAQMHNAPPTPPNDDDSRHPDLGGHSTDEGFVSGDLAHNNSMSVAS
jgi:serine/arginine repetitive matrix protein 2